MAGSFGPGKVQFPQLSSDPTGADGDAHYNSTDGVFRFRSQGEWVDVGTVVLDGSTEALAAPSGTYLYDELGYTTDGIYWIKPTNYGGSAIQCRVWFSNSSYGRGAVLVASYGSQSGFAQSNYSSGINTSDLTNNNYFSSQNNSRPSVLPRDFINALVADSTTNHTMGGICAAQSGNTYFQYRDISAPSKGTAGSGSLDMWRYMFATGAANNNLQFRMSGRLSNNDNPSGQISRSFTFGSWYTYTGGRGGSDGANNYHYMPDDETGGGEWWFRENEDDSCHQAYGRAGNDLAFVW